MIWSGLFTLLVPSHLFSSSSHSLFLRDAPCSTKQASKSVFWHKSGIALKTFYFPRIFLVFLFWESKDSLWFWTKMCFFFPIPSFRCNLSQVKSVYLDFLKEVKIIYMISTALFSLRFCSFSFSLFGKHYQIGFSCVGKGFKNGMKEVDKTLIFFLGVK